MIVTSVLIVRRYEARDRVGCRSVFESNVPKYFAKEESGDFESFLSFLNADFFVAENQDGLLGCGGVYVRQGIGRLCWGMVDQRKHRQNIGSSLLRFRVNYLFADELIECIEIETSQHSSDFFAKFGFEVLSKITNGISQGIDSVTMRLERRDWRFIDAPDPPANTA